MKPSFVTILGVLAISAGTPLAFGPGALGQGLDHPVIGARAPGFDLVGQDGRHHRLSDYRGKVVVLEWTSPACPFTTAKYTAGQMQDAQKAAARQGVVWLSINTSAPGKPGYLTASKAKARIKSTGAKVTAFLFDNGGKAGRLYGARTTPGAYVIGKDGQLLYQGAVDDDDRALGEVHHNYVTEALADIAAHRPVAVPETRQYGCPVEY